MQVGEFGADDVAPLAYVAALAAVRNDERVGLLVGSGAQRVALGIGLHRRPTVKRCRGTFSPRDWPVGPWMLPIQSSFLALAF